MPDQDDPGAGREATFPLPAFELPRSLTVSRCRLVVAFGPGKDRELVSDGMQVRVGTAADNDLVLEDPAVSARHFEIRRGDQGFQIIDLGSLHGTWVDGQRVESAWLGAGAQIRAGSSVVTFSTVDQEIALEPAREEALAGMIGGSPQMQAIFAFIRKVAPMDVPVVIQGETGTGKELAARAIHDLSTRSGKPYVVLDCGSIPPDLIESELFGHEAGAFTGAVRSRAGAFERAHGGTILLDELGELRLDLQPKLLRVLEAREVQRVGGNEARRVDVRVLAATNRDLVREVTEGRFRKDLYFRLAVINLQLPPLRERPGDVARLAEALLAAPAVVAVHGALRLGPEALQALTRYRWPGNVRELSNVVSHVLTHVEGREVRLEHLPARVRGEERSAPVPFNEHLSFKEAKERLLESFEKEFVSALLARCQGSISRAAAESGLHRTTIERLMKRHGLAPGGDAPEGPADSEKEPGDGAGGDP